MTSLVQWKPNKSLWDYAPVIQSKLLAKAVIEQKDGKILIVAVFERSDYHHFFFVFTAKSKRSPRKSWTFSLQWYNPFAGGVRMYETLEQFVESRYSGCAYRVIYPRGIRRRDYRTFHRRIAHPFENFSQPLPAPGSTFRFANSKSDAYRRKI